MRLAIIALVLLVGLTVANIMVYQREMRGLQSSYSGATGPVGAVVGAAVAQDATRNAARDAWLRQVAAFALTGVLWFSIARTRAKPVRG